MSTTTEAPSCGEQLRQIALLVDLRTMADRLEGFLMVAYNGLVAAQELAKSPGPSFLDSDGEPSAPLLSSHGLADEVKEKIGSLAVAMRSLNDQAFYILEAAKAANELGDALAAREMEREVAFVEQYEPGEVA